MIRRKIPFPTADRISRQRAGRIVQTACQFSSQIMLEHGSKIVNGKSTLGLLSLSADEKADLYLIVSGEDEQTAAKAMEDEIKGGK